MLIASITDESKPALAKARVEAGPDQRPVATPAVGLPAAKPARKGRFGFLGAACSVRRVSSASARIGAGKAVPHPPPPPSIRALGLSRPGGRSSDPPCPAAQRGRAGGTAVPEA